MQGVTAYLVVTMADKELTLKQHAFIAAYLGDAKGNATEAARMAGYEHPIASAKDNMRNPTIRSRVKDRVEQYAGSAEEVLTQLRDVATADWRDFIDVLAYDKKGNPVKVRMDLSNKVKALELLGKYHQLFVERQEINVNVREHRVIGIEQRALDAMFQPAERPELNA